MGSLAINDDDDYDYEDGCTFDCARPTRAKSARKKEVAF